MGTWAASSIVDRYSLEHSNLGKKKFQFDSRYRIDFFDSIRFANLINLPLLHWYSLIGWWHGTVVERRSLAGELSTLGNEYGKTLPFRENVEYRPSPRLLCPPCLNILWYNFLLWFNVRHFAMTLQLCAEIIYSILLCQIHLILF